MGETTDNKVTSENEQSNTNGADGAQVQSQTTNPDAMKQLNLNPGSNPNAKTNNKVVETYLGLSNETSLMEIDLVTARQKGEEIRYLLVTFGGKDARNNEQQNASISIDEGGFNQIKKFFAQLEWGS